MAYNYFTLDMLIQQFGLRVVSEADALPMPRRSFQAYFCRKL